MNKRILGLDLGITSIGWTMIEEDGELRKIIDMGCRIVPLSKDDNDEFTKGNAISKNQNRTAKRTQRKGYDRYQLRRTLLKNILAENTMMPGDDLFKLSATDLFGLRDKALSERVTPQELGRILYHLNQKRGFKSSRLDAGANKNETDYVAEVKSRYAKIQDAGQTVGQWLHNELKSEAHFRVKDNIFPRDAYTSEFDAIINAQKKYHTEILNDELVEKVRNKIIFYQRRLKSQKNLVSVCEFAGFKTTVRGAEKLVGPKVAPRSSPLAQVCKIWETINNIRLKNKRGEILNISPEFKQEIYAYLDDNEKMTQTKLFEILKLKKNDGWSGNKQIEKGISGNQTKAPLTQILKGFEHLLEFELEINKTDDKVFLVDKKTGEQKGEHTKQELTANIEHQPLYKLWHVIYSIDDVADCRNALQTKFDLPPDIAEKLANIDFKKGGFGNKSVKAMRRILPYLMDGYGYSEACEFAGYSHSDSLTSDEKSKVTTKDKLELLPKNSLRQPVVEKILNQLINLINALIDKYGAFEPDDEIRVELARELKQSIDERNQTYNAISKKERENNAITKRIEEEYASLGIRATRNTITKWRLFHEINNDESKANATCIYCGQPFGITDSLRGSNVEIEHIIPKSLLFDDSQSNKTLVHSKCNSDKGNRTAYDFMTSKGEDTLNEYIERVDNLYRNQIIRKSKRDKLLMPADKIPTDFIDRQLRATQYITRKATELLADICKNVWCTSGSITSYLRKIWGWDDVLMNLQLPKYQDLNLTEIVEWKTNDGQIHRKLVIKDWTKRKDHRHHAIDALTIACTQQRFIQKINTLSAKKTRDEMYASVEDQNNASRDRLSLLDRYFIKQRPFVTAEVENAAAKIIVSYKAGKRVAKRDFYKATGINKEKGVLVPRGPLSEKSVYGKINTIEKNKPIKYLFENPELIYKKRIKLLIKERLSVHDSDVKKAMASIKKEPIYFDANKTVALEYGSCYAEKYVIKYPIESLKPADAQYIVDEKIKAIVEERFKQFENKPKEAFKEKLWLNRERNIEIKSVRCYTGLSAVEPVKRNETGEPIGFVKPGSNHHIAFYTDENGMMQEHICTFWHAVERKKYNIPVLVKKPKEIWNKILTDGTNYLPEFIEKLPKDNWCFCFSMEQNEMFLLGLSNERVNDLIISNNTEIISQHLYRVQKIAATYYVFRHHLETELDDSKDAAAALRYYSVRSIKSLLSLQPQKVIISNIGTIQKSTH